VMVLSFTNWLVLRMD